MAVNKVEVDGETKLDLTADTVTPETLLKGATAHNAAGEAIVGSIIMPTYTLVVKTSPSAAITVTKGTKTFSGTADASGECTFSLPEAGVWTVTIGEITQTVTIGTQSLTVPVFDDIFANNTWGQIALACHMGVAPDTWKIADQKEMTINGTDYLIDIIGKNHDEYANISGKAPLTLQLHDLYGELYPMYPNPGSASGNYGGWTSSYMRSTYLPGIFALMPTEVQNGIRAVRKTTTKGYKYTSTDTTADSLFLLSKVEVFGSTNTIEKQEGTRYAYYLNGNATIKMFNDNAGYWFLRSPYIESYNDFCAVNLTGRSSWYLSKSQYRPAFAFSF